MHILFLTDNFPPEVNAPASRTFEHCREWVKMGNQVTVITCSPNFPKGKVFPGYSNRIWQTEHMDGIKVVRVWSYITANDGFVKRILDYISFMISAIIAAPFIQRVDVVIGTSPQFFTACAAYFVSLYKRVPFVFELRDIWPESIKAVGAMKNPRILYMLECLELFLYRKADAIISVTNSFRQNLKDRGVDQQKIHVITNGVDLARFQPQDRDSELSAQLGLNGKFVVGYVGTHGMAHALETILEAAEMIRKEENGDKYRFVLLGDGARREALRTIAQEKGLDNIFFIDSVPKQEVVRYWSLLDVSIIHLKKTKLFASVIPSKLFECMGMGIPVLHGVAGESAEIVKQENIGIVFEPENAKELCSGIMRLHNDESFYQELRNSCHKAALKFDRIERARRMYKKVEGLVSTSK